MRGLAKREMGKREEGAGGRNNRRIEKVKGEEERVISRRVFEIVEWRGGRGGRDERKME